MRKISLSYGLGILFNISLALAMPDFLQDYGGIGGLDFLGRMLYKSLVNKYFVFFILFIALFILFKGLFDAVLGKVPIFSEEGLGVNRSGKLVSTGLTLITSIALTFVGNQVNLMGFIERLTSTSQVIVAGVLLGVFSFIIKQKSSNKTAVIFAIFVLFLLWRGTESPIYLGSWVFILIVALWYTLIRRDVPYYNPDETNPRERDKEKKALDKFFNKEKKKLEEEEKEAVNMEEHLRKTYDDAKELYSLLGEIKNAEENNPLKNLKNLNNEKLEDLIDELINQDKDKISELSKLNI